MSILKNPAIIICMILPMITARQSSAQTGDTTIRISLEEYKVISTMRLVNDLYIEKMDTDKLADLSIKGITDHLDPHTQYLGNNCSEKPINTPPQIGLGMVCRSYGDTLTAVSVDPGGPAYRAGIRPGYRIAYIGNIKVADRVMTNGDIRKMMETLPGDSIQISYFSGKANSTKTVTSAIDTTNNGGVSGHYSPNDSTIYVKISFFNKYTAPIFENTIKKYPKKKRRNIILDLRNNPGGMWKASSEISNHFFGNNYMITKAVGDNFQDTTIFSDSEGMLQNSRLYILINENTGSASEVIAGCVQDWDRGVIIGRRSYGKGLIQQIMKLKTGEKIAITRARLITPAGRCVQREYRQYSREDYMSEPMSRKLSGENISESKMRITLADLPLKPTCTRHRMVHSGAGIVPDIFVAEDTTSAPEFWTMWIKSGLVQDFCYQYVYKNINRLNKNKTNYHSIESGQLTGELIDSLEAYSRTDKRGIQAPGNLREIINSQPEQQAATIKSQLNAGFAKAYLGPNEALRIINNTDADYQKALYMIRHPDEYYKTLQ